VAIMLSDKLADIRAQGGGSVLPGWLANGPGQVNQINPLQGNRFALRHHPTGRPDQPRRYAAMWLAGHGDRRIQMQRRSAAGEKGRRGTMT